MKKPRKPPLKSDCTYCGANIATRGRLNRMFKYFKGKPVVVYYEYNNSLGGHDTQFGKLAYDAFEIITGPPGDIGIVVKLRHNGKEVWSQDFTGPWEFTDMGKLRMPNSGPYCYFKIEEVTPLVYKLLRFTKVI